MSAQQPNSVACSEFLQARHTRRALLKIGGLGLAGLTLPRLLRAEEAGQVSQATARSVILLFQFGGPSHLDTFDPKPDAAAEIRGEFKTIQSNVPGIEICEHLPSLAKIADKFALVRSVRHRRSSHNPAAYYALTGHEPILDLVTLNASSNDYPALGSVVSYLDRQKRDVPNFVALPTMIADGPFRTPGEFAGFLGKMHDPLFVTRDPNAAEFRVDELTLPEAVNIARLGDRRGMLNELNAVATVAAGEAAVAGMDAYRQRAFDLLTSPATQRAFAIEQEDPKTRDRYGRTTYGQSCLLARRLVEAGVRFVTVYFSPGIGGWDTHQNNFKTLKESRLPQTDQTVSALLEDLSERGLLSETLVYWLGDFGRTPKINATAGRDHWPACQTVLMSGGGVRGGQIYGSSDKTGAVPRDNPHRPDDITATVFHALGFDCSTEMHDQVDRTVKISDGEPITALFG